MGLHANLKALGRETGIRIDNVGNKMIYLCATTGPRTEAGR